MLRRVRCLVPGPSLLLREGLYVQHTLQIRMSHVYPKKSISTLLVYAGAYNRPIRFFYGLFFFSQICRMLVLY